MKEIFSGVSRQLSELLRINMRNIPRWPYVFLSAILKGDLLICSFFFGIVSYANCSKFLQIRPDSRSCQNFFHSP